MNQKQNAEQMLGVGANASPEEISNAFQARVSELVQKNLPSNEFQNYLNQLYAAHDLLTKQKNELELSDTFFNNPFEFGSFKYIDNFMKQMKREMDHMFDRHHEYTSSMRNLYLQSAEQSQLQNQQNQEFIQNPQNYRYVRSFSKAIKIDKNGNIVGSSNKVIQNNDKIFKEEKHFDSTTNKIRIKRYKPDGTVKEFEKPYYYKHKMLK